MSKVKNYEIRDYEIRVTPTGQAFTINFGPNVLVHGLILKRPVQILVADNEDGLSQVIQEPFGLLTNAQTASTTPLKAAKKYGDLLVGEIEIIFGGLRNNQLKEYALTVWANMASYVEMPKDFMQPPAKLEPTGMG